MRILLTGTHRTGKTTLANEIAKRTNLTFVPTNVSRLIESTNKTVNEHMNGNTSIHDKLKTQLLVAKSLSIMFNEFNNIITDRSLIDVLAYTDYIMMNEKEIPSLYHDVVDMCMYGRVIKSTNIIIQINESIAFDANEKSGDFNSQRIVQDNILNSFELMKSTCSEVVTMPAEIVDLNERVEWVLKYVN